VSVSTSKRHREDALTNRVEVLTSEFAQIKSLILNLQPREAPSPMLRNSSSGLPVPEEDRLSTAASQSQFREEANEEFLSGRHSNFSHDDSQNTTQGSAEGLEPDQDVVRQALQIALARLSLDTAPTVVAPSSSFFRGTAKPSALSIPPSKDYIEELQKCWANPKSLTHHTTASRALAAMHEPDSYGLGQMPKVDPFIASFIISPEEAWRPNVCCPRPQCRITDDLLSQAYNTAARMGRIGNSLSHLMLALSQSLQPIGGDPSVQILSDASLQAFAFMSRELGRLMSTLTQARRQVWLAQSPLSEACRRTLRDLPVVPGQLFGPAAQQTLEQSIQTNKTRQQLADLRGTPPSQIRQGYGGRYPTRSQPLVHSGAVQRSQPRQLDQHVQYPRARGQQLFRAPRGRTPGQRPPRDNKAQARRA